jgi:hypothetical protein
VSKIPLSLPMEFGWVALQPSSFRTWTQAPPLQPTHALNIIIFVSLSSRLTPPLHVAPQKSHIVQPNTAQEYSRRASILALVPIALLHFRGLFLLPSRQSKICVRHPHIVRAFGSSEWSGSVIDATHCFGIMLWVNKITRRSPSNDEFRPQ